MNDSWAETRIIIPIIHMVCCYYEDLLLLTDLHCYSRARMLVVNVMYPSATPSFSHFTTLRHARLISNLLGYIRNRHSTSNMRRFITCMRRFITCNRCFFFRKHPTAFTSNIKFLRSAYNQINWVNSSIRYTELPGVYIAYHPIRVAEFVPFSFNFKHQP